MRPLLSLLVSQVRSDFPRSATRPRRGTRRRLTLCRLSVERLEDRTVPTVSISVADASLNEIGTPSAFIATGSGGLASPAGITLGPDSNVYVASNNGAVLRYNGTTGAYMSTFVSQGSGGLGFDGTQAGLTFGPDGNLYVTSNATHQVLMYNGSTGAFVGAFVSAGSGGLTNPRGLAFGPDGSLYVTSYDPSSGRNGVMRYQGPSGASPGSPLPASGESWAAAAFTPIFTLKATDGGGPRQSIFGPDGNLYVDGGNTQGINRYDGTTGAFLSTFVSQGTGTFTNGRGMAFDQEGRLYVGDSGNAVHRYDAQGQSLGDLLVNSVNASLSRPLGLTFDARGRLLIACSDSSNVVRYDRGVMVSLSAASPTAVSVGYATTDGSALAGTDYFALSGMLTFNPGQTSQEILLATQEEAVLDGNETLSVQLSNPTAGATIANGNATVTIVGPTRSFSVADSSAVEGDHTAHYRGAFVQGIPGNSFQWGIAFGPDGNLYASTTGLPGLRVNAIGRFNGTTGAFMGQFTTGQNGQVREIAFHNGYLYVATQESNDVVRYDGTTGAFVDVFVPPGSGGLGNPHGLTFGPDGNLYVTSAGNAVLRYDSTTGAPLGTLVAAGSGGLSSAGGMAFDPSGAYLYVASSGSNQVLKYNGLTGAYVGLAANAGLSGPSDVAFGLDGLLYVLSSGNDRILRYTASGTYVDDYVPAGSGGTAAATSMTFGPDGDLYVATLSPGQIMQFGTENEAIFTVTNTTPSTVPLTVTYTTANGTAVAGSDYTAATGTHTFAPGVTSETIRIPLLDDGNGESNESFTITLSNAVGAAIADDSGVATILDDDATKFFVVDDGGTDRTYRYDLPGNALGNSTLNSGNTAPRGAASNAAGTTVWVADANKNVYVYNPSGALLGSWTAGGLTSTAQLEGLATNGTDIWLLDNKQDKVFKYTGAASRLSGSQSAASSFKLASGNTDGKGIVTDGSSIWVVNDGIPDKVYKYTLSGTLLGSWTIDAANASPTGLTIDPANVSAIWIVDNGTDKVYQYTAAAGRTSGSQTASAIFALAAGNTNPQDIADPPPPDRLLMPAAASPAPGQSSGAAFEPTSAVEPSPSLSKLSLANPDMVFALLVRNGLPAPSVGFLTGGALTPYLDSPARAPDRIGGPKPLKPLTPLTWGRSQATRPGHSARGLVVSAWADEGSQTSAVATDSLFANLAADTATEL